MKFESNKRSETLVWVQAVPNETSQLKDFEHIAQVTRNFEKEIADEGLIANFDPVKGDKLSIFASDVEVHFASKKRKHVLARVRSVLMQSDYGLGVSPKPLKPRLVIDDCFSRLSSVSATGFQECLQFDFDPHAFRNTF